ncbi:hypothetical protein PMM47T1_23572 [Pseudomonas sp. M47T1]|uniref:DUF2235 domain-containing protein n=1 Tax=Pseudomonas sp. M47T1 TaxID=1179778 RepID=UPI0002607B96|nr:DUF2235 domain-containing protein [Pseudomonas sp. M47T1]EIK94091.1 hypothetical protein PMM47T1_23572 [Pseudomonas sp. M47T1]
MGRQLVVCLDGTNNRFSLQPTNIIRLIRCVSADPAQVLSYYDQGVGTFGLRETLFEWQKLPSRLCGLALGWGLKRTVGGAYRFLAKHYRDGDQIYLFGFSRGAYAVRALAALIDAIGLVPGHEAHLFDYAWSMLQARNAQGQPAFKLQDSFKATFGRPVKVHLLGLFDTVKSVGWIYDPLVLPYTASNALVENVRQALSIDERRCFFRPNLWQKREGQGTDVRQVWFAGVHSDVGGGYSLDESGPALLALRWMLGEARALGLALDEQGCERELQLLAAGGPGQLHDSMTWPWKLAEWLPRRAWSFTLHKRVFAIGIMPPFGEPRPRYIAEGALLHHSVVQRLESGDYHPVNLPRLYSVVDDAPFDTAPLVAAAARRRWPD